MQYHEFLLQALAVQGCHEDYEYLKREMQRAPLHPIFVALIETGVELNLGELIQEWPHVSKDGKRIAYTASVAKGAADIQSVADPLNYLSRWI